MSCGSEDGEHGDRDGELKRAPLEQPAVSDSERPQRASLTQPEVDRRRKSSGCERKVSIRRRKISSIVVGENPKPVPVIQWGQQVEEYEQIVKRVMMDPYVTESVHGLTERLRLLTLMHDDCRDMIMKRSEIEKRKRNRIEMKRTFVILTYTLVALSIFAISLKIVTLLIL